MTNAAMNAAGRRERRLAEVNRVARILMDAWEKVEGKPVNVSYVATFADMARAIVDDRGQP